MYYSYGLTRAKGDVVLSSVFYPLQVELFEAETMKKESIPSLHMSSFLQSEVWRRWSTLSCADVCVCVGTGYGLSSALAGLRFGG